MLLNHKRIHYITNGLDIASKHGHTAILDWFKNSGFEFKYSKYAIDWASQQIHDNYYNSLIESGRPIND